jgi:seryl-tRNA synthetase
MLDIRYIREHPEVVRQAAADKRIDDLDLDRLLEVDGRRRELIPRCDGLRSEVGRRAREAHRAPPEAQDELRQVAARCKAELKATEAELREVEEAFRQLMLRVPQPPAAGVPVGVDEADNVELERVGEVPAAATTPLDHIEIGRRLGLLDFERAVRIAGTRTYYLTGDGALLEAAVLRLALDRLLARGFRPFTVPVLVRPPAMVGTAYYPGGEEQAYQIEKDGLSLVGTAEVSLASFHLGEILDGEDLPCRYAAHSVCFRREAGAAGRDTKGLYRVHQFTKVEQVVICAADEDEQERLFRELVHNARDVVELLELPYRLVNVCTGDLGRGQQQKLDLECWMPSRDAYGETHSASRFGDYQARRLKLRYRARAGDRPQFPYTLNNTAIASPRILIPLLEIHQQPDGSVRIPEALRPYLGGRERLEAPAP